MLARLSLLALAACCPAATISQDIHSWSARNLPQYRKLVDEHFAAPEGQESRANAYRSMASLVCTADTAEGKKDSPACACHHATSDDETRARCKTFFDSLSP
jgi:hypothetical protein